MAPAKKTDASAARATAGVSGAAPCGWAATGPSDAPASSASTSTDSSAKKYAAFRGENQWLKTRTNAPPRPTRPPTPGATPRAGQDPSHRPRGHDERRGRPLPTPSPGAPAPREDAPPLP